MDKEPWHNEGEASGDESSESDEVDVRKISGVKNLGPLIDWLFREHGYKVFGDLKTSLASWSWTELIQDRGRRFQAADTRLMSKVRNDGNHVVVKAVANIGVTTVPHSRSHGKSGETSFETLLLFGIDRPVWVITNSSGRPVVSNVGNVVAVFVDDHLLLAEETDLFIFIVTDWASGVRSLWSAATPVVSLVHVVMLSAVALEIFDHTSPGSILRWNEKVITIFDHAALELLVVVFVIFGTFAAEVDGHVIKALFCEINIGSKDPG